jgi:hypothetical protein
LNQKDLRGKIVACLVHSGTPEDTEIAVILLHQVIPLHVKNNCPLETIGTKKDPRWSPQSGRFSSKTRKLLNKARRTGMLSDW